MIVCALAMLLACGLSSPCRAGSDADKELTSRIEQVLKECGKIKPGATRAKLLQVFKPQGGGLSTGRERTFVHRRCPYIKVDVEFTPAEPKQGVLEERPTDIIRKISRPYLEWMIAD